MKNYCFPRPVLTAGRSRRQQGGAFAPILLSNCWGQGHGRLRGSRALPKVMRLPREALSHSPAGEYAVILLNFFANIPALNTGYFEPFFETVQNNPF